MKKVNVMKEVIWWIQTKGRVRIQIWKRWQSWKPVFAANGVVTAGNASQTSDGAAFVVVMSERGERN